MLEDVSGPISQLRENILETWRRLDPERLRFEVNRLEQKTAAPDFWDDRERAEKTLGDLKRVRDRLEPWRELVQETEDLAELLGLAQAENDSSVEQEIRSGYEKLQQRYEKTRILELLGDPLDANPAFLTIHAGAGGTEACDWAAMLLRMYSRWIERREFKSEVIDLQEAEGGVKSVTMQVDGTFAFGYLKAESGVHRLVRISPFDSSARRHTSFASVAVSPVIEDDIEVDVRPEDIRVDTYRASGAGGQHVNKTDSAVRITHLETGLVVQCQNERSQHKNRATAMKVLRSRLYELYHDERRKENEKSAQEKKEIAWGSQIRSYVFHPYNMVKDHRTKKENGNVQAVMDGDIDGFIEEYLKAQWAEQHQ
ncbi:MAG: peptide chain release factor 2 [Spirochaetaceae bacterium]|nr:MAG: peptide chain release factor 2 [Spirochaetaceae bacterium]